MPVDLVRQHQPVPRPDSLTETGLLQIARRFLALAADRLGILLDCRMRAQRSMLACRVRLPVRLLAERCACALGATTLRRRAVSVSTPTTSSPAPPISFSRASLQASLPPPRRRVLDHTAQPCSSRA
jgi:hypothetical protein